MTNNDGETRRSGSRPTGAAALGIGGLLVVVSMLARAPEPRVLVADAANRAVVTTAVPPPAPPAAASARSAALSAPAASVSSASARTPRLAGTTSAPSAPRATASADATDDAAGATDGPSLAAPDAPAPAAPAAACPSGGPVTETTFFRARAVDARGTRWAVTLKGVVGNPTSQAIQLDPLPVQVTLDDGTVFTLPEEHAALPERAVVPAGRSTGWVFTGTVSLPRPIKTAQALIGGWRWMSLPDGCS